MRAAEWDMASCKACMPARRLDHTKPSDISAHGFAAPEMKGKQSDKIDYILYGLQQNRRMNNGLCNIVKRCKNA